MTEPLHLRPSDSVIRTLKFKRYRNSVVRHAEQFLPEADEPQTKEVKTPWGETLVAKNKDYIVHEAENPGDRWPVNREVFENSYQEVQPGRFVKRPFTYLVPLVDITGDPDRMVTVHTMEGAVTVRAGDFYLSRGKKGEIWPFPREKVKSDLQPVDE